VRLGVVHVDRDDRVRLDMEAFVPEQGFEEKAYYLAKNIHDHLAATAHNLRGGAAPYLERSVHYVNLSQQSVDRLKKLAERAGMQSLKHMNRAALGLKREDVRAGRGGRRMTFGVYFYSAEDGGATNKPQPPAAGKGKRK
jgi:hypothetical protein